MINLIKNELCKIFHKKNIYIYTLLIAFILVIGAVYSKHMNTEYISDEVSTYTKDLEENLANYDLNNRDELSMYISDKVTIDINKLSSDYKYESPERYYIENTIEPLIYSKYQAEYLDKDETLTNELQTQIDDAVSRLKDFDWERDIKKEIAELEGKKHDMSADLETVEMKSLDIELWCLQYRLENKVPYSYDSTSLLIDEYQDYAKKYITLVKDEDLIVKKEDLIDKRDIEKNYHLSLYKLENHMVGKDQDMIGYIIESFAYIDGIIVVAIVIIAGAIISEEFNKGTIKQLLVKPHSRSKILLSKIIASLIAILAFILVYNGIFILVNCYEYSDFTSILGTNAIYDFNAGKVREISVLVQCLYGLVSVIPAYLIIFCIAIFIGILTTSTIASNTGTFGIYVFADSFGLLFKPKVLSYLPFYCWDLSPYRFGGLSYNEYSTLGKSLTIDVITILVLLILSFIIFKKKEIKNQ